MTTVISVRGRKPIDFASDPNFVYVGRAVKWTDWNERSPFANPFWAGIHVDQAAQIMRDPDYRPSGDDTPVSLFERWVKRQARLMAVIDTLKGCTLGCWCGVWKPGDPDLACHAVILAKMADALGDQS